MTKRMIIMLVAALLVFGGVIGLILFRQAMVAKYMSHQKPPPVVISAKKVTVGTWHPYLISVGTLVALQNVNITTEASGTVTKIYFNSGDYVTKGQPLIDLDTRVEQANLESSQATLKLAEMNYERQASLYKSRAISKSILDDTRTKLEQAKSEVAQEKALLAHKHIVAPFDGQLGIRQVNLGEYLSPGQSAVVNIQAIDPIYIDFSLPQQELNKVYVGQPINFRIDGIPNREFKGKVSATNVGVDANSRMLLVRATTPNTDQVLKAGMFADVHVLLPIQEKVITVPQTAITYNLYGDLVYVIEKGHAKEVFVAVGQRQGDRIVIDKGLHEGDTVVTAGQIKLYNGAPVTIDGAKPPKQAKSGEAKPSVNQASSAKTPLKTKEQKAA